MLTEFQALGTGRKAEADGSFAKVCQDSFKCWFDSANWKVRRFRKSLLFIPWRPGRTLFGPHSTFLTSMLQKMSGRCFGSHEKSNRKTSITSTVFHYCPRSRWPIQKITQFSSRLLHLSSIVPFMCFLFSSLPQIFGEKVFFLFFLWRLNGRVQIISTAMTEQLQQQQLSESLKIMETVGEWERE